VSSSRTSKWTCLDDEDSHGDYRSRVIKDKIGDSSVKLQFNQEEAWTRALRHVLLALKILLKWTTSGNNG
jgi:beclin 1